LSASDEPEPNVEGKKKIERPLAARRRKIEEMKAKADAEAAAAMEAVNTMAEETAAELLDKGTSSISDTSSQSVPQPDVMADKATTETDNSLADAVAESNSSDGNVTKNEKRDKVEDKKEETEASSKVRLISQRTKEIEEEVRRNTQKNDEAMLSKSKKGAPDDEDEKEKSIDEELIRKALLSQPRQRTTASVMTFIRAILIVGSALSLAIYYPPGPAIEEEFLSSHADLEAFAAHVDEGTPQAPPRTWAGWASDHMSCASSVVFIIGLISRGIEPTVDKYLGNKSAPDSGGIFEKALNLLNNWQTLVKEKILSAAGEWSLFVVTWLVVNALKDVKSSMSVPVMEVVELVAKEALAESAIASDEL
jgi:hypothetical protein